MLAATSYMFQEFFSLPGYPVLAERRRGFLVGAVGGAVADSLLRLMVQVWSNKGKFTMMNMFEDPKRVPGDLGIDPLKFGENAATRDRLEMAELRAGGSPCSRSRG